MLSSKTGRSGNIRNSEVDMHTYTYLKIWNENERTNQLGHKWDEIAAGVPGWSYLNIWPSYTSLASFSRNMMIITISPAKREGSFRGFYTLLRWTRWVWFHFLRFSMLLTWKTVSKAWCFLVKPVFGPKKNFSATSFSTTFCACTRKTCGPSCCYGQIFL